MQREITVGQPLLNEKGNIENAGYAKSLIWEYDRSRIKAKKSRIKEWDYYYIANDKFGLCVTMADLGYVGALSVSTLDFTVPSEVTNSSVFLLPLGKVKMPPSSKTGGASYRNGKVWFNFENNGKTRHLTGSYPNYDKKGKDLEFDIVITDEPQESIVIAIPFKKEKYFYYNQKINCMTAEGFFNVSGTKYSFDKKNTLATLDWGRGVWTYDNTWYWGSLQTVLENGKTFGFNIGYGFGDASNASENMIFYDGKSHKIEDVDFGIPGDKDGAPRYMDEWQFTSSDKRLNLVFKPLIDRYAPFDLKIMCMMPHQVFGYFSGECVLDDGEVIKINNILGFAEKVHNKW